MSIEETGTELQQFLQAVVEQMVERPDEVRIVMGKLEGLLTFDVSVAPDDIGRVIGRHGQTARSIRTIFSGVARKHKVNFELVLPRGGREVVQ